MCQHLIGVLVMRVCSLEHSASIQPESGAVRDHRAAPSQIWVEQLPPRFGLRYSPGAAVTFQKRPWFQSRQSIKTKSLVDWFGEVVSCGDLFVFVFVLFFPVLSHMDKRASRWGKGWDLVCKGNKCFGIVLNEQILKISRTGLEMKFLNPRWRPANTRFAN